jgi:hypothetical protein
MSQKKVFSRETIAGLIVTVLLLSITLAAVSIVYFQTISSGAIHDKNAQIADLQTQVNDLKATLNLEKVENLVNDYSVNQVAGNFSIIVAQRSYQYSGYLLVSGTSTTNNAWVNLQYWFNGKLNSFTQTLGTSGELFFAIPKTDSATVYVGNLNPTDWATETLTIDYHY